MGSLGSFITSIIALATTASTVLVMFLSFTRMTYGISKKKVIPKIFQVLNKNSVPIFAALLGYIICVLVVLSKDISSVAGIADFGALSIFATVNLVNIVLRYKRPHLKRNFKTPLNIGRFPLVSAFGLISAIWMILHLEVFVILVGLIILGLVLLLFARGENVYKPLKKLRL
jgi:APA family basic amino acid/polyamine antiporter